MRPRTQRRGTQREKETEAGSAEKGDNRSGWEGNRGTHGEGR